MWTSNHWQDYELLDCGDGKRLERWGNQILVRPDPQAIWETDHKNRGWRNANARYSRSSTGGGHWDKKKLPESWPIRYKDLTFQVKPMNFKHTGLFPEQAANWDFAMEKIRNADRPINVLNLFAYTGGATVACAKAGASIAHIHVREDKMVNGEMQIGYKSMSLKAFTAAVEMTREACKKAGVDIIINLTTSGGEYEDKTFHLRTRGKYIKKSRPRILRPAKI